MVRLNARYASDILECRYPIRIRIRDRRVLRPNRKGNYEVLPMKVKALIKALRKAPNDAEVMIRTYGYSQSTRDQFDIDRIIEDPDNYQIILVTE